MIRTRQFKIVILRTGAAAQGFKIEPDHPVAAQQGRDIPPQHLDTATCRALSIGHRGKIPGHFQLSRSIGRAMENLHLLQRPQAIVDAGINLQHIDLRFDQGNGRQEVLALQTVRVEAVRRVVGRHDKDYAALEQGFKQPAEDHCIRDVGNMKLIEADQPGVTGNTLGDAQQGIAFAFQLVQLPMNIVHEGMKMDAPLATIGHRRIKTVHQETLAPPDATPEIEATRRQRGRKNSPQRTTPRHFERQQLVEEPLQALGGRTLCCIGRIRTRRQQGLVGIEHAAFRGIENSMRHKKTFHCAGDARRDREHEFKSSRPKRQNRRTANMASTRVFGVPAILYWIIMPTPPTSPCDNKNHHAKNHPPQGLHAARLPD